jgi:hypothetical protein
MQSHGEFSLTGGTSLSGLQILVGSTSESGGMLQQPGHDSDLRRMVYIIDKVTVAQLVKIFPCLLWKTETEPYL